MADTMQIAAQRIIARSYGPEGSGTDKRVIKIETGYLHLDHVLKAVEAMRKRLMIAAIDPDSLDDADLLMMTILLGLAEMGDKEKIAEATRLYEESQGT